jgi:hypothetical protein
MNHREAIISFLAEMAVRSTDIHHVASGTREERRFFQWGSQETALVGSYALNNTGWNLLIDMMPAGNMDNAHSSEARLFTVALHFIRQADEQDLAAINNTINEAWDLGWEFLNKAREHCENPCTAGLTNTDFIPGSMLWGAIKHQEVAPLIFIGDHHYGYRFEVPFRYVRNIPLASTPSRWNDTV